MPLTLVKYVPGGDVTVGTGEECCWGCTDHTRAEQCGMHGRTTP